MNSQGKIRSSDFSANDFPGKERHIRALSIRPNFPAKNIRNVRTIRGCFENFEIFG